MGEDFSGFKHKGTEAQRKVSKGFYSETGFLKP